MIAFQRSCVGLEWELISRGTYDLSSPNNNLTGGMGTRIQVWILLLNRNRHRRHNPRMLVLIVVNFQPVFVFGRDFVLPDIGVVGHLFFFCHTN